MSPVRTDAPLWVGLALLGWCSALLIHKQLAGIRTASAVIGTSSPLSNRVPSQQTQDAITLSTLSQLLQTPNPEIREAATKIIAERALQSPNVWRLLWQDLSSATNSKARNQALSILVQFRPESTYDASMRRVEWRSAQVDGFFHPRTFSATVTCLCNMLPAARDAEIRRQHHQSAEADALWFAIRLLDHNSGLILKAGLVRKWLANYPLNLREPEKTKEEVIREMIVNYEYNDDYERLLCCLLYDLTENPQARQEMLVHGLGESRSRYALLKVRNRLSWGERQQHQNPSDFNIRLDRIEHERAGGEVQDIAPAIIDLSHTMGQSDEAGTQHEIHHRSNNQDDALYSEAESPEEHASLVRHDERIHRPREELAEQRAIRGRRREAMVFAEPGRALRWEDIIESQPGANLDGFSGDDLERMIEEPGEEMVIDADQETARGQRTWAEFLVRLRPDGFISE